VVIAPVAIPRLAQIMMKLSAKAFVLGAAGYFLLACLLYYGCFNYACGRYIKSEWWIKDIYAYKHFLNNLIESPRIIISGGSNSLFGIDSDIIHEITGYNVLNIASHAGLDISFHYLKLREYMQDGDIVIIPLEYQYYRHETPYSDWFIDNMIAWGKEDYIDRLSVLDRIQFIFHVPKTKIFSMLTSEKKGPVTNKDAVVLSIVNSLYHGWNGYNFKSMNKNGEMLVEAGPLLPAAKLQRGVPYLQDTGLSDHFLRYFRKITKLVRERHGRVILTWPPSIKNRLFDLSTPEHKKMVSRLAEDLEEESITISCEPEMFNLDIQYFFNTEYHLNKRGAQIRTERLARCINDLLRK
jgi:hypothetical protein